MSLRPKKLIAMDHEDLDIISAFCQDAVLKIGDLEFVANKKRFIITMNRFAWENGERQNIRTRSVLHFERVQSVSMKSINLENKNDVLSLLAVTYTKTDAPAGIIDLVFSGDGVIRLKVECVEAQLADMNAVWEASSKPAHPSAS